MKSSSAKLRALFLGQVFGVTAAHPALSEVHFMYFLLL